MPTLFPINWKSPAELYKTMYSCFIKTTLVPDNYLLGHLAVHIKTPLLQTPLLTGMASAKPNERVDYIFKEKIGFAILGATLKGRLETEKELAKKMKTYSQRQKLAFITYRINEQSTKKILRFIESFSHSQNNKPALCNYYGGAFWPRYQNEGAGCTAFGLALLDVAHLQIPDAESWMIKVNIPMNIIGGEYNNQKKIEISSVLKTESWHNGSGVRNVDYVPYHIYDPSIIFQWILNQRIVSNSKFIPIEKDGVPGLYIDCKDINVPAEEPIFTRRPDINIFINKHLEKMLSLSSIKE